MSLLSTFAILFETNASQATRDTEGLSDALDGTESSAEGAAAMTDAFAAAGNRAADAAAKAAKDLAKMAAAYFTVKAVVDGIIGNALGIDTIGKLSQTIGENIVMMDAWGEATARNGGSAEALRGTVESLQGSLQDISITGGGEIINTLAMIGVQATKTNGEIKSAFEILPEIGEAFKKMSTEQSFAFGKRLGLDQGTILTLQQSRYEVDKLVERQKMLGGATKEGYENAAKFNDQWDDTKRVFNSLWLSANNSILPLLQGLLEGFEKIALWIRGNQSLVEGFFIGLSVVLLDVAILTGAISLSALIAVGSFLLVAAAITGVAVAVALVYEDVKAWVNGSKSAIGELVGTFEELKTKVTGIFDSLSAKWDSFINTIKDGSEMIGDFFSFSDKKIEVEGAFSGNSAGSGLMPSSNEMAQHMIKQYSSTNLNHGGSTSTSRTQTNNFNVAGSTVDARGMSGGEAKSTINAANKNMIEMAIGQLTDGIQR